MKKIKKYKPRRLIGGKQFSQKQESARSKGYDAEWDRYRFRFLHHNKDCYACSAPSKVCDHLIPAKVNKEMYFWKLDNFVPLCSSCHNFITGKFDRLAVPDTEGKMKWLQEQREIRGLNNRVKIVPFKFKDKKRHTR